VFPGLTRVVTSISGPHRAPAHASIASGRVDAPAALVRRDQIVNDFEDANQLAA
jgi:hypothetical protein